MKHFLSLLIVPILILLAGCSKGSEVPTNAPVIPKPSPDDHHTGETNVAPHEHDNMQNMMPPSRSRINVKGSTDDHHAGETDVDAHAH